MSKEELSKEVKKEKSYKININYINFIAKVIKNKIVSKELVEKEYSEIVNLRVSNISRVDKRNKRKEVRVVLLNLLNSKGVDIKEYNKFSNGVVNLFNKRSNNYIEVKV